MQFEGHKLLNVMSVTYGSLPACVVTAIFEEETAVDEEAPRGHHLIVTLLGEFK